MRDYSEHIRYTYILEPQSILIIYAYMGVLDLANLDKISLSLGVIMSVQASLCYGNSFASEIKPLGLQMSHWVQPE